MHNLWSFYQGYKAALIILILWMEKLRLRKVKCICPGSHGWQLISLELEYEWYPSEVRAPLLRCSRALESKAAWEGGPEAAGWGWLAGRLTDTVTSAGLCSATFQGRGTPPPLLLLGDPGRQWTPICFCGIALLNHSNHIVANLPTTFMFYFYVCGSQQEIAQF